MLKGQLRICAVLRVKRHPRRVSGDNGEGDPPVPIPNTEVKPLSADGTWLATARESRSSPGSFQEQRLGKMISVPYPIRVLLVISG